MYLVEVFDPSTGNPVQYYKVIGAAYSECVTDTVTEANGWTKVRLSLPEWQAHERRIIANLMNTKKFWLS